MSVNELYPLKFIPIFKEKIWGGQKIYDILGKEFHPLSNCGETWELSGVKGNVSIVSNGPFEGKSLRDLIKEFEGRLVGTSVYSSYGFEFPLLIKFIDANDDLSIQVHPNDALADKRHNSKGKTEMWYVMDAEPGTWLYNGFSRHINPKAYRVMVENNTITAALKKQSVAKGDVYFIPAGRVHSIGKGIMIAEIQQTSDITYRIYDFDRRDSEGKARELHTLESQDAIDFSLLEENRSLYKPEANQSVGVVECPFFHTSIIDLTSSITLPLKDRNSFTILMAVDGNSVLRYGDRSLSLNLGEVILVPAEIEEVKLFTDNNCRVIETYMP